MKSSDPNFFDDRAKTYVRFVLDELKLSPSALAKKAGLASTTLTRALNDPTHKYTLSMSTLGKIYMATGVNFNPFFEPNDFPSLSMMPYTASDLYDESWGEGANATGSDDKIDAPSTLIFGEAAIGVWKEERLGRIEDLGILNVVIPGVKPSDLFALKMADESAAPYVRKEDYALCRRRYAHDTLEHGGLFVIERRKYFPSMMELSIRRLIRRNGEAPYLRADNFSEKYAEALLPRPDFEDTDELKIVGHVLFSVRPVWDEKLLDERNEMWLRSKANAE